tara:strand:+ start:250 stop:861 length:612 start_codon:yes stop_codon:yes gene_type:complete
LNLYLTLTSPYGRIARIVRIQKKLEKLISLEVVKTRLKNSPYYNINPSGRVPAMSLKDGSIIEDSRLICWYMDHLDENPSLHPNSKDICLEHMRLESTARSMLDGTSLIWREIKYRSISERSMKIMEHEYKRAYRLADLFEKEINNPILSGELNMAQIILTCVLHGPQNEYINFDWQEGRPNLQKWLKNIESLQWAEETQPKL